MRRRLNPIRTTGDDHLVLLGETCRDLPGHEVAIGGRGAGAGDRDQIRDRPRQQRGRALGPQHVRGALTQIDQAGRPIQVAGDQGRVPAIEQARHQLIEVRTVGCQPYPVPEHLGILAPQLGHRRVGVEQPDRFDATDSVQQPPHSRVAWFGDDRQHDAGGAVIGGVIGQ